MGTGRVVGAGLDAGWQISPELRVIGEGAMYQQVARNNLPSTDWTQRRGSLRFEWTVGRDPGNRTVSAAARKAAARAQADAELARVAARSTPLPATAGAPEIRP